MNERVAFVLEKLNWMKHEKIWPNGLRYLWTDAFGLVLLVSLYHELQEENYLRQAEELAVRVESVLGRKKGLRIGEAKNRDGQYFHYLMMWAYALLTLGLFLPKYREKAIQLIKEIHPHFIIPGMGIYWKAKEDLSGPYPGYGLGALDPFHAYIVYRLLDSPELSWEIKDVEELVLKSYRSLRITQDLGLGMMLWMCHFFPAEEWAKMQSLYCQGMLDIMWIDPPGFFCREPEMIDLKYAFTNYGVSLGLQAMNLWRDRVIKLHAYFKSYRSGDEYDREAITHVMACTAYYPGLFLRIKRLPVEQR